MFRFTVDQFSELSATFEQQWLARLAQDFRARFPQVAGMQHSELQQRLHADLGQLREFALRSDSTLCRMLEWTIVLGPAFWKEPRYSWVRSILAHLDRGERERVGLIDGQLTLAAAGDHAES